jgi:hypothetical protein
MIRQTSEALKAKMGWLAYLIGRGQRHDDTGLAGRDRDLFRRP